MVTMMSLSLCLYAKLMNSFTVGVAGPNGVKAALVLTGLGLAKVLGAGAGSGGPGQCPSLAELSVHWGPRSQHVTPENS